ncbi:hypothetical protein AUJ84_00340 [Candidatus Pacearchaeota archaeon CG1_02_32_132]|nr:MAG: hypothetical protein AUJ84_00340 [Candidatus Pacearchaeota archaeon CG1_02_32_132]
MLKLKPSVKIRRRYILVNGNRNEIEKAILDYIGILGWSKAVPFFVKKIDKGWILAVDRKELDNVKAGFSVSKDKIQVIRVSGTIKGLGSR